MQSLQVPIYEDYVRFIIYTLNTWIKMYALTYYGQSFKFAIFAGLKVEKIVTKSLYFNDYDTRQQTDLKHSWWIGDSVCQFSWGSRLSIAMMSTDSTNKMKVEKSLMNPDFEGYKLSLENIATFTRKLPEQIKPHSLGDDQVMIYCLF